MDLAFTHPFSRWRDQVITDKERYQAMVEDTQHLARRSLVFGMHVHVCIPDQSLRIDVMNQMVYFMPFILALSASSPFWQGQDTGLKSYRSWTNLGPGRKSKAFGPFSRGEAALIGSCRSIRKPGASKPSWICWLRRR